MPSPFWNHIARLPRHRADRTEDVVVEILRVNGDSQQALCVELTDLSRHGAQVDLDQPLSLGEPLVVRIRDFRSDFELQLPATVRWQHAERESVWSIGCQFQDQLAWEDYGELFLNGILESDLRADE